MQRNLWSATGWMFSFFKEVRSIFSSDEEFNNPHLNSTEEVLSLLPVECFSFLAWISLPSCTSCIYSSLPWCIDSLSCDDYLATPGSGGWVGVQTDRNEKATEMQAQKYPFSLSLLLKLIQITVKRKILQWLKLLQILTKSYHLVILLTFCSKYRMNIGSLLCFSFVFFF